MIDVNTFPALFFDMEERDRLFDLRLPDHALEGWPSMTEGSRPTTRRRAHAAACFRDTTSIGARFRREYHPPRQVA